MQSATVVQICVTLEYMILHKIVSHTIKYESPLLKGSTMGTTIKIINSTVKEKLF